MSLICILKMEQNTREVGPESLREETFFSLNILRVTWQDTHAQVEAKEERFDFSFWTVMSGEAVIKTDFRSLFL